MNIKSFLFFLILVITILISGCGKKLVTTTLSPSEIYQGEDSDEDNNDAFYCIDINMIGTCKDNSVESVGQGQSVTVGFQNSYDPGTEPAACWVWADCIWRAYVRFDFNDLPSKDIVSGRLIWKSGVHQHVNGVASAVSLCKITLYTASQQWSKYKITGEKIAEVMLSSAQGAPNTVSVSTKILLDWANGLHPNYGFFFVGPTEQLKAKNKDSCYADLSDIKLEVITAEKK